MQSIAFSKNIYLGSEINIIASGPSMNYYDASFFLGKLVIGVNNVYRHFPVSYVCAKHKNDIIEAISKNNIVFYPEYNCGDKKQERLDNLPGIMFSHNQNQNEKGLTFPDINKNEIIVSSSTITTAIHIACHLGAKKILVYGHDCKASESETNYKGYYATSTGTHPHPQWYANWLTIIKKQTDDVIHWLKEKYKVEINVL